MIVKILTAYFNGRYMQIKKVFMQRIKQRGKVNSKRVKNKKSKRVKNEMVKEWNGKIWVK